MSVEGITFPVPYEHIPQEIKRLREIIESRRADIDIASTMLGLVRRGCDHKDAKRGYNERDGDWMNPCPHCGASE